MFQGESSSPRQMTAHHVCQRHQATSSAHMFLTRSRFAAGHWRAVLVDGHTNLLGECFQRRRVSDGGSSPSQLRARAHGYLPRPRQALAVSFGSLGSRAFSGSLATRVSENQLISPSVVKETLSKEDAEIIEALQGAVAALGDEATADHPLVQVLDKACVLRQTT